jgi:hypothetical protein
VSAAFTSSNSNYDNGTGPALNTITIGKAHPTLTTSGGTFTYDGNAHASTGTAKGVDGITTVTGSFAYTYEPGGSSAPVAASATPYSVSAAFTSSDSNYDNGTPAVNSITINKAHPTLSTTGGTFTYDGNAHASTGTALGVNGVTPVSGSFAYTYTPGGSSAPVSASATPYSVSAAFTSSDGNYDNGTPASNTITINTRAATWTTNGNSKMYGNSDPSPLTTGSGNFLAGDNIGATYGRTTGSGVSTYHITATLTDPYGRLGNYYPITNTGATFTINPDPTAITLDLKTSGYDFDCLNHQYIATLKDTVTNTGLSGVQLTLTVGAQSTTATTDSNGVATFTLDLNQTPGSVTESVGLTAAWADPNRVAPTAPVSRPFTVIADPNVGPGVGADTLYTGSRFFWTTSATSSTATLTLTATIKDKFPCGATDITKAKVSFWISSNGGTSWSPVSSGQNLPVGLVDPSDKSTGTASIISQYDLAKALSNTLWVKVTVGGEYIYGGDEFDVPVTVALPGQLNTLLAGGSLMNDGASLAGISGFPASGYFGAGDGVTSGAIAADSVDFSGQVTYNKGLTNPQGQLTLFIRSWNKLDGTQDGNQHTYWVKSNSIADLAAVGSPGAKTASFSSKTNVYEIVGGSKNGLDGGGVMQFMFTQPGGTYQVSTGTGTAYLTCPSLLVNGLETKPGCASVIVYKSTGGVWFSSAWGPVSGLPQTVEKAMKLTSGSTYIQ